MAYTSQSTSPRSNQGYANKPSPRKHVLEDGPIKELVQVIEESRPEQWQKRTNALADLVAQIPTGNEYSRRESWYNSPPTLRHLHQPVGELLKDPRSTVVKRTCEALTELFAKCQGDAKYLFKDLMPVILNVHAQTVQVIRSQVQTMVLEAIPVVPCKMVMPLWLERLKTDKSRTVREACSLYLGMGLKHWTNDENSELGASYLTDDNWIQIGSAFIHTLRDPSPSVRSCAKSGIAIIRDSQPDLWDQLIRDPDGPAGKDTKLQKWLIKVSESGEELSNVLANEELSVASRYSHYSHASKTNKAPSTPNSRNHVSGFNSNRPSSRGTAVPVQISVGVGGSSGGGGNTLEKQPARQMRGLGPPLRRPFAQAMDPTASSPTHPYGSHNQNNGSGGGYPVPQLGTPPRPPIPASPGRGRPPQQRSPSPSPRRTEPRHKVPLRSRSASSAGSPMPPSPSEIEPPMEDGQSVYSQNAGTMNGRTRARPNPESLNNGGVNIFGTNINANNHIDHHSGYQNQRTVIDLVDQASPRNLNGQDPPQDHNEYGSGIYSNATSTDMLDVTKSIDQTLAHPFLQQQQQQLQLQHQSLLLPPNQQYFQAQQQAMHGDEAQNVVVEEGPFIASMNELKLHASKRRSRRSMTLQERWSRADSIGSGIGSPTPLAVPTTPADAVSSLGGGASIADNNTVEPNQQQQGAIPVSNGKLSFGGGIAPAGPSALPEHYIIAEQLLRVHKTHVDQIMETLKIEMDTLRDFEQSLEQEQAPTPDQVLDYFESVGLCLDQRTTAGNILQREMDRISKGAFQHNPANGGNHGDGGR